MDVIRLVCPECDAVHRVKNITLGKLYRCKKCKSGLITMQPAVLVCPACGATRPPAHIEVSRLITCDECEQSPVMEVRIAGVSVSGELLPPDAPGPADEADALPAEMPEPNAPAPASETSPEIPAEVPAAAAETPAPAPQETPTAPAAPDNVPEEAPRPADDLTPPAPRPRAKAPMDTHIIRKMLAETAPETLPPARAADISDGLDLPIAADTAYPADSFPAPAREAPEYVAARAPLYRGDDLPPDAAPAWARSLNDNLHDLLRRLDNQRASAFSRPVFSWLCLGALIALYGWLLSASNRQQDALVGLKKSEETFRDMITEQNRRLEEQLAALKAENANLANDMKIYYENNRTLKLKLEEKTREINMLNKAYRNQFGGPEIK